LFLIAVELRWLSEKAVLAYLPDLVLNRKNITNGDARFGQGRACLKKVLSVRIQLWTQSVTHGKDFHDSELELSAFW
jgi:hypothetical protein